MRPPRIAILALFVAACLFLLCRAISSAGRSAPALSNPAPTPKSALRSLFSFSTPFTLFSPNAIITIADDNTTSFAARPAGFGPPLPIKGLNGRLWIGGSFTEETLQDGEDEGELGCSDVPGWVPGKVSLSKTTAKEIKEAAGSGVTTTKAKNQKREGDSKAPAVDRTAISESTPPKTKPQSDDDGTDDYLHQTLEQSEKLATEASANHADIQSMQEAAEIAGKIVLLSRGGCGFLEKVKWAQRRGAVALIVGDNQKGAPLIQMFARGDTSNVTIPSVFTSRTTAYLLSLMQQPGSFIQDIIDENGKTTFRVQQAEKTRKNSKKAKGATPAPGNSKTEPAKQPLKAPVTKKSLPETGKSSSSEPNSRSWISGVFSWGSAANKAAEKNRPPSSGQLDWVLVEDFSDERDKMIKTGLEQASTKVSSSQKQANAGETPGDDFQIGVQDWRDPDLVGESGQKVKSHTTSEGTVSRPDGTAPIDIKDGKNTVDQNAPKGGSITPGSGEYKEGVKAPSGKKAPLLQPEVNPEVQGGFWSEFFGKSESEPTTKLETPPKPANTPIVERPTPAEDKLPEDREGLWVTITPTSGASPFFDTLLVLVISPLITLTVVYALLILRARIRRRRWRAPKSVVERLPVRTYHTVVSTPSRSPRLPSPTSSSPTTPLLQSQHNTGRSRPRSRTTTGVPTANDLLQVDAALQSPRSRSRSRVEPEKGHALPSEWKKYMSRQSECVVCLEEYVDGVSQVMSLPCGHEFHVECITPWLTTRRRTCPICKGDVVRSLARGSPSSPRYEPYRDDSDDEILRQASSSASQDTAGRAGELDSDPEQGILAPAPRRTRRQGQQDSWFGTVSNSFRTVTSPQPPAAEDDDRDR